MTTTPITSIQQLEAALKARPRVLVACEFSGIVREAFKKAGWDAWSCDLLDTEISGQHVKGDVHEMLKGQWDLIIAHPPCTDLAVSGARWFKNKVASQKEAIDFFMMFTYEGRYPTRVAIENPVSIMATKYRKPDQIIQPWQFGHGETKATCLWLRGLPLLQPTKIVEGRKGRVHQEPPGPNRWKERSRTYQGIADAMAQQWGGYVREQKALTLISQLKQSVEAKRDEIVKMQERGSGYDPITLGVVLKKFDEIIGEGT